MTDTRQPPQPIVFNNDEAWTQSEADRLAALVERWAHVLVLLLAAICFAACADRWWWCGLLGLACLLGAGWRARQSW